MPQEALQGRQMKSRQTRAREWTLSGLPMPGSEKGGCGLLQASVCHGRDEQPPPALGKQTEIPLCGFVFFVFFKK